MLKLIYKVSIIVILNFLNIFSFSYAEIIQKIEIVGNERIPGETIKMFSNVSIGDDIKNSDLNIILMNIYDSDFFTDVKVSINKNNLIIKVVESPLVENVFIGSL